MIVDWDEQGPLLYRALLTAYGLTTEMHRDLPEGSANQSDLITARRTMLAALREAGFGIEATA